ncbi:MAG TPA: hypothetical protein VFY26_11110, partial [Anaerolineales bacterium]|nr:hypothetical protein [Anaerolineales bacterium]
MLEKCFQRSHAQRGRKTGDQRGYEQDRQIRNVVTGYEDHPQDHFRPAVHADGGNPAVDSGSQKAAQDAPHSLDRHHPA